MRVQIIMKNAVSKHRTNLGRFTSQSSQQPGWQGGGCPMKGGEDVFSPTNGLRSQRLDLP